ncbi:hypothetical protein ACV566_04875 [Staphylococcus aureus]
MLKRRANYLKDLEVINPEADILIGMHGSVTLPISVSQMTATSEMARQT